MRVAPMGMKGTAQGQKAGLEPSKVAAIKAHLLANGSARDRALFALAIDSMLRGCDLVRLRVRDVLDSFGAVRTSLSVVQGKVSAGKAHTVECHLTDGTRTLVAQHVHGLPLDALLFRGQGRAHSLSTKQVRRMLKAWCEIVGLDPAAHSAHTLRRTKASLLYRETKDLELVRIALGHSHLTSTQAYLAVGREHVRDTCLSMSL